MTFFAGQTLRAADLNDLIDKDSVLPLGILARGNRTTSSTTTTTEQSVLRLDDIPMYLGRAYKIWTSPLQLDTTVANDVVRANLRITTDGSTPTTSSTVLSWSQTRADDATNPNTASINIDYTPTADELFSVLLTVARTSGTGNVSILAAATAPINLVVEDIGLDPTDTGTDL